MAFTLLPATAESLAEIPPSAPLPFLPDETKDVATRPPQDELGVPEAADAFPAPSLKDGIILPDGVAEVTDLTAGIPQVEVERQPAGAFALGENEWDVADRKTAEQKWRRLDEGRDLVERAKLDEEGFYKGDNLGFAGDPAKTRMLATNDLFLQVETDGAPVPPWGLERDFYIGQVGARLFPGKDVSTPEALSQRISEFTQGRKNKKELLGSLCDEATKAETFGSIGEKAPTFQAWREKAKTMPGYESGNDADYYEAWARNQKAAKEYMAPFRDELGQVWKAMKQGGAGSPSEILKEMLPFASVIGDDLVDELQKKDAGTVAFEIYDKLDTAQRAGFMNSLHLLVKSFPKEEQADVLANLGKTGGRMVDDIGRGIMGRFTLKAFEEHMNDEASKTMGPWGLSEADKNQAADNTARIRADRLLQRNFTDAIRSMERDEYAPLHYLSQDSSDVFSMRTLEDGFYAAPPVAAFAGTMMIPYAGPALSYLAAEDFAYRDLRDNSIKAGASELESSLFAEDWKSVVAVPQTLVERLQVLAPLGRLPMVNDALDAISRRVTNRVLGGVVKVGAMNAAETGTEEFQHLMPYVAQDLAHAFAGDTRTQPAQWYNGKDGAFDGFWNRQATTFISMFPLAAFTGGHGGNREARNNALTDATPLQRRAFGITEEDSAAIDEAGDPSSRDAAIAAALSLRDPSSAAAQAATDELETQLAKQQDTLRQAQETGTAPRIIRTADGTHAVLDGKTGEEIGTASDLAGATRLAATHMAMSGVESVAASSNLAPEQEQQPSSAASPSEDIIPDGASPEEVIQESDNATSQPITPIGPGVKPVTRVPAVIPIKADPTSESITEPSLLRKHFWSRFDIITQHWPKIIKTPEGPITWSKAKTGDKLRSFKTGEPAALHYLAAANLPELLANSTLASVESEAKGDHRVREVHRRYAWATFPNGERRHILLTVDRMSEKARSDLQKTDHAYAAEVLGVSLEVLPGHKDADVVNLKEGDAEASRNQAVTSAQRELNRFLAGIKAEHRVADTNFSGNKDYEDEGFIGERLSKVVKRDGVPEAIHEKAIATKIFESVARKAAEPEDLNAKTKRGVDRARHLHAQQLTPTPEETQILASPYEIVLIYTADGRLKKVILGEKDESTIPPYAPADAIITHNHPGGRGPSDGDIASALRNPGRTMRIVTRNENGDMEIFQFKAMKKLSNEDIEIFKNFYSEKCHENGDTSAARREALFLTFEKYPDIIEISTRILP